MPTHKIHLAIAKKVSDKLNLDTDSVMLGSVLPDICNEKNHQLSHFPQMILQWISYLFHHPYSIQQVQMPYLKHLFQTL